MGGRERKQRRSSQKFKRNSGRYGERKSRRRDESFRWSGG
jgi:hypothetical protein